MQLHRAPAKVNLRLTVLAREDTGYHQIETLFCALELADELTFEHGGAGIALEVDGADVGPPERNLVYRAARAFHDAAGIAPAVRIRLRKNIPAGAGLGGGSSDAATTLRALNARHAQPLPDPQLLALGAALGSDIPFFLSAAPLALAWGRGDRVLPLAAPPRRPVLVIAPRAAMSTAHAYAALARRRATVSAAARAVVVDPFTLTDWSGIEAAAVNDFEDTVFEHMPGLVRLRAVLRSAGAAPALLSGSGSALFGVFPDERALAAARDALADSAADAHFIETHTAPQAGVAPSEIRR